MTTDFLIRAVTVIGAGENPQKLPVDLLTCQGELETDSAGSMISPALFRFAGDETDYVAPAFCVLDAALFTLDPDMAWRHARTSISRLALKPHPKANHDAAWHDGEQTTSLSVSQTDLRIGRYRAALQVLSEPQAAQDGALHRFTIAVGPSADHSLRVGPNLGEMQS